MSRHSSVLPKWRLFVSGPQVEQLTVRLRAERLNRACRIGIEGSPDGNRGMAPGVPEGSPEIRNPARPAVCAPRLRLCRETRLPGSQNAPLGTNGHLKEGPETRDSHHSLTTCRQKAVTFRLILNTAEANAFRLQLPGTASCVRQCGTVLAFSLWS